MESKLNKVQLLAIINNSREAVALQNAKFQPIYRSPSAFEMLGWTIEERQNNEGVDKSHPDDSNNLKKTMEEVLKNPGKPFFITFRTQHKKGHYIWLSSKITNLLHDENIKAIVSTYEDVTEKKKFEEEKVLSASIINSSDDAILSKTLEGMITSWNEGAEKIFGYFSKEIIGKHISTLIPDHLRNEENEIIKKIRNGEKIDHYETERIKKDDTIIYVSLTISPIKDSTENIIGVSKIARDITERKKAERKLEQLLFKTEENLLKIFNASPSGMLITDTESRKIVQVNNSFLKTF